MGEARRRHEAGTLHSHRISAAHDPLPDFVFGRLPDLEAESGFPVAGHLFTSIPRQPPEITNRDIDLICEAIRRVARSVSDHPETMQVGLFTRQSSPANALPPPYEDAVLRARATACHVIEVLVDPDDLADFIAVPLPLPPAGAH